MRRLLFVILMFVAVEAGLAQNPNGSAVAPYKNPDLPVEQRVQDLSGPHDATGKSCHVERSQLDAERAQ